MLAALAAGKHVICEKPFARDTAEARQLLAATEAASRVHLLGTEYRFDTGQALMARALREGAVGEPRLATFLLHVSMLADPSAEVPDGWADTDQGGGWLGAHGSQVIDQIRFALGEFEAVSAALHSAYERRVAHGLELVPYTRLAEAFRDRILGRPLAPDVRPATFADGVAAMSVLDAIRGSAAQGGAWTSIG